MSKHTPGPYTVTEALYRGDTVYGVRAADGDLIANGCLKRDAELFAAAPDLLAACRTLLDAYNEQTTPTHMEWRAIEAAIAKAEGRS